MRKIIGSAIKSRRLWMFRLNGVQYFSNGHIIAQADNKASKVFEKHGLPERGNYELTPDGIRKISEYRRNILAEYIRLDGTSAEQAESTDLFKQTYHGEIEIYTSEHYTFGINREYAKAIGSPLYYHPDKKLVRTLTGGAMVARLDKLDKLFQNITAEKTVVR